MQGNQLSLSLLFCCSLHGREWFPPPPKVQILFILRTTIIIILRNGPLEFASEHPHQIRQTSGLIHSPYGSFDPLMDEYPTFGELNTGDYSYSDRPVFVIQSETSDISGISSSVEEAGGAILDYMPDSALLVRLPIDVNADNFLASLANVRWSGQMPDIWRLSPEILGDTYTSFITIQSTDFTS